MAGKSKEGNDNLQQAMALLNRNRAAFVSELHEIRKSQAESELEMRKSQAERDRRFARIESELEQIKEQIWIRQSIEAGMADSEADRTTPVEQIRGDYGLPE